LMHGINSNNPFIQNLCNSDGKNNCNAILKSDASRITSWLSWSEVGFFYFTGSLLSLLFAPSSLFILAWVNVMALPYTIYSLSYQYRNKTWCALCCTVQALLVLELITALVFGLLQSSLS
ncbi:MAG: vitamin K epoxide reductase family protein, partial [Cytophagaceae bacterium]